MLKTTNAHHWVGRKPDPSKYFGFIYLITCKVTGRMYIGKKQYHIWHKRKIAKENNWHYYTGSSKDLNYDIKSMGKESFEFKILKNFNTRGGLSYGEVNLQHKKDVLTTAHPDGRLYYNKAIGAIRFIPKEF